MQRVRLFGIAAALISLFSGSMALATVHDPLPPGLRCPGDRVVWLNTLTGVFHFQGERYFGNTKQGQYMCEKQALAEGDRATENGQ